MNATHSTSTGRVRWVRVALIGIALALWFATQAMLARRAFPAAGIDDAVFRATAGLHDYLTAHAAAANALLIVSSAVIDALGLFLLGTAIFGRTIRPFLGLLIVFVLRQAVQGLVSLPAPPGMIWRSPGFPSLLVTYGTAGDLFFSGHTAIAVYGATELARLGKPIWRVAGLLIGLFEIAAVLILRAHYTMDVVAGVIVALWVASFIERLARPVDCALIRLTSDQR